MGSKVHPTAIVESGARLGDDVEVGPYAVIGPHVELGNRVQVGAHAVVTGWTSIGDETRIWPSAVIGDEPQDRGFEGGTSFVEVGPRCQLREYVTIHRGTQEGSKTIVGEGCMLMAASHVAHNCTVGDGAIFANGVLLAGHVDIAKGVFLSGNVVVHQFTRVGQQVMTGGLTRVTRDTAPFFQVKNDDEVVGLNLVGLRRSGAGRDAVRELKSIYKGWAECESFEEYVRELQESVQTEHGRLVAEFLAAPCKRGFNRPPRDS